MRKRRIAGPRVLALAALFAVLAAAAVWMAARGLLTGGAAERNPSGEQGAEMRLESADKLYTLEGNAAAAKTDAEGRFAVGGIRAGRYNVRVSGMQLKTEIHLARDGQDWGQVFVR